jgi:putative phosphoesterase
MIICILSDSHDRSLPLARAVRDAADQGAEAVLHCGDVISANTLRSAMECGIPLHVVHGNNLGDTQAMTRLAEASLGQLVYHGDDAHVEFAGRRIFMVHYPEYGHALACTGDWDLVCCGHDHRASIARIAHVRGGTTWLVNPGTIAGIGAPPTYVLGDLSRMEFSVVTLASDAA